MHWFENYSNSDLQTGHILALFSTLLPQSLQTYLMAIRPPIMRIMIPIGQNKKQTARPRAWIKQPIPMNSPFFFMYAIYYLLSVERLRVTFGVRNFVFGITRFHRKVYPLVRLFFIPVLFYDFLNWF